MTVQLINKCGTGAGPVRTCTASGERALFDVGSANKLVCLQIAVLPGSLVLAVLLAPAVLAVLTVVVPAQVVVAPQVLPVAEPRRLLRLRALRAL